MTSGIWSYSTKEYVIQLYTLDISVHASRQSC
jgi:hypothetical protein